MTRCYVARIIASKKHGIMVPNYFAYTLAQVGLLLRFEAHSNGTIRLSYTEVKWPSADSSLLQ